MNFFFRKSITYTSFETIDIVQSKLQEVIKRKWFDFSNNLRGNQKEDGSFVLIHKWTILGFGPPWADAYVTVKLEDSDSGTLLKTVFRPNPGLLILFYVSIIWLMYEVLTMNHFSSTLDIKIFFFVLFTSIIFAYIKIPALALRKSFERFMGFK